MMLEAVWFKDGKEVYKVFPVENIVCYENMEDVSWIEVRDKDRWHNRNDFDNDVDDFVLRVKND